MIGTVEKNIRDIVIIDDESSFLRVLVDAIDSGTYSNQKKVLNPIPHENISDAIAYIEKETHPPFAYLVDMQLPGDLEGSERFFNYLKDRRIENNFFFMTGHISKHDLEVQKRTGARIIDKPNIRTAMYAIIESI